MADAAYEPTKQRTAWREVSARLADLKKAELARVNVAWAIEALSDAFEAARAHARPSTTSGLVIQQAWFKKGYR